MLMYLSTEAYRLCLPCLFSPSLQTCLIFKRTFAGSVNITFLFHGGTSVGFRIRIIAAQWAFVRGGAWAYARRGHN